MPMTPEERRARASERKREARARQTPEERANELARNAERRRRKTAAMRDDGTPAEPVYRAEEPAETVLDDVTERATPWTWKHTAGAVLGVAGFFAVMWRATGAMVP